MADSEWNILYNTLELQPLYPMVIYGQFTWIIITFSYNPFRWNRIFIIPSYPESSYQKSQQKDCILYRYKASCEVMIWWWGDCDDDAFNHHRSSCLAADSVQSLRIIRDERSSHHTISINAEHMPHIHRGHKIIKKYNTNII